MNSNKKDGVSVKEIEDFAKKHRFEVFSCLLFLLACIFGLVGMFSSGWSIFLGMVGAALGIILPAKMDQLLKTMFHFVFKQEKTLLIVLGAVGLLIACTLPFVIFLVVGVSGGHAMYQMANNVNR